MGVSGSETKQELLAGAKNHTLPGTKWMCSVAGTKWMCSVAGTKLCSVWVFCSRSTNAVCEVMWKSSVSSWPFFSVASLLKRGSHCNSEDVTPRDHFLLGPLHSIILYNRKKGGEWVGEKQRERKTGKEWGEKREGEGKKGRGREKSCPFFQTVESLPPSADLSHHHET